VAHVLRRGLLRAHPGTVCEVEVRRIAYIADNDHNHDLDAVLADVLDDLAALRAEGREVLVHCHGGASRTGLVLRAWLMRTEGTSPGAGRTQDCGTPASPPHWLTCAPEHDDGGR
jgi:hypothetical protein